MIWILALSAAMQVVALPTDKLAWDVAAENTYYQVRYNTEPFVNVGLPPVVNGSHVVSLPSLPGGSHVVEVQGCNAAGCASAAPLAFSLQLAPQPCSDIPSVFVTRWEHTTGKPGSRMRVNFQLGSISPIAEIDIRVNGSVVASVRGSDLRDAAGVWFTTPAAGSHKLQVFARNSAGCTKLVYSPVDLVVR